MSRVIIDINADVGESYKEIRRGDEGIFPYLSSCNIACGFHGGDPLTMERTIELALEHQLQIGAHPSYPDLEGFGRRSMVFSQEDLQALVKCQLAVLKGMVEAAGGSLQHVKPHGALYNDAGKSAPIAAAVLDAIYQFDRNLILLALPGTELERAADEIGVRFVAESFADRNYLDARSLVPRSHENAVIEGGSLLQQFENIVLKNQIDTQNEGPQYMKTRSICFHSDHPNCLDDLEKVRTAFGTKIIRRAFGKD